jgi:putative ABC transport system ATP-binding protein
MFATRARPADEVVVPRLPEHADAVHVRSLVFGYRRDSVVLRIPELRIPQSQRVFMYGPSGSGKTTLLGLIAGVLRARSGAVEVLGKDLTRMSGAARDAFRGHHIGYIFQLFNLIPYLSVLENITLPCRLSGARRRKLGEMSVAAAARDLAQRLGLDGLLRENVTRLSVGQQQRVAAARALLGDPELVIADEPTSSLDVELRQEFLELLFQCCRQASSTLLFVSHDRSLAPSFDRAVSLPDANEARAC